jgi:uncharacterized membrane protein YgcG
VKLNHFILLTVGLLSFLGVRDTAAARSIPPPPLYYVLDEAAVLSPSVKHAVESLLVEHDHLTGQQIQVAVFKDAGGEKPALFAHQVFQEWKIGKRGRDEGVLFSFFMDSKTPQIEVGYGLEAQLSESESEKIIEDFILPDIRKGQIGHALASGAFHLLEVLNSPLIQSGKASELLGSDGITDVTQSFSQASSEWLDRGLPWKGWFFFLVLGSLMVGGLIVQFLAREAHFTASGWFRPYPWELLVPQKNKKNPRFHRPFLKQKALTAVSPIIAAIQEVEAGSAVTLRVHISKSYFEKEPEQRAKRLFTSYGMDLVPNQKGLLIYINLRKMRFQTIPGTGYDPVMGPSFWRAFHLELERNLRSTQSERGIALSIKALGETLKKHFPSHPL